MESNQRKTIALGVVAGVVFVIAIYFWFLRKPAAPELTKEEQKAAEAVRAGVKDDNPEVPTEAVPSRRVPVKKK